jgi:hypothetical protein
MEGELNIFNILDALGSYADVANASPYEDRKVDRYQEGDLMVSTASVVDLDPPYVYETAISHPDYNDGEIIPVDCYISLEEAKIGHKKWLKLMLENPPNVLKYGSKNKLGNLSNSIQADIYERKIV